MGTVAGVLSGVLALSALQLALSNQSATSAVGALATAPTGWFERFVDPDTPLIPDRSASAAGPSASTLPGAAVPPPGSLPPATAPTTLSV